MIERGYVYQDLTEGRQVIVLDRPWKGEPLRCVVRMPDDTRPTTVIRVSIDTLMDPARYRFIRRDVDSLAQISTANLT